MAERKEKRPPTKEECDEIQRAVSDDDVTVLWEFIIRGIDINNADVYDKYGRECKPLHVASKLGHNTVIKVLHDDGGDLSIVGSDGWRPLHYAAANEQNETVKLLMELGADINVETEYGNTPLIFATENCNDDVVKMMIEKGANVDVANQDGNTPLHFAAGSCSEDVVKMMIEREADIHAVDDHKETPLHWAAMSDNEAVVKFLVTKGADLNAMNKYGRRPLHDAVLEGRSETVKLLMELGADVNVEDEDNKTPIEVAVDMGHSGIVYYFVKETHMDTSQFDEKTRRRIGSMIDQVIGQDTSNRQMIPSPSTEKQKMIQEELAYRVAITKGMVNTSSFSIYFLGQENSGKTCLVATLLGDDFKENLATHGADVEVCTIRASNWCRVKQTEIPSKLRKTYHFKLRATAVNTIITKQVDPVDETKTPQELLENLPKLSESVEAEVKKAKVAVSESDDGIDTIIWDFAGQSIYDGLHCMFLKECSVIAIVFDASQDLHAPSKCRDSCKDPYTEQSINPETTGCESVCYWLKTLHSICCCRDGKSLQAKSKFIPTAFFIATHIDEIGNEEAIKKKRQQIIDQLVEIFREHDIAQHLAGIGCGLREALEKFCFFISNKVRNKNELDRLKHELIQAAQYILDKKHPLIYLDMERKFFKQEKPVITTEEFHAIAIDSGFSAAIQSEEFKGALTYFHNKGAILHFPDTELLQNLVVLSPEWLTKLISYVIVAHPYKISGSRHDKQYDRLQKQGILLEDFIVHMTQTFNEHQQHFGVSLTSEQVINLIKHFKLVAQIDTNTRFLEEKVPLPVNDGKVFIVPSILPLKLSSNEVTLPSHGDKYACIVHFIFPEHFLPLMVFYQLLTFCIERNIERREDLCFLRRHLIKFMLGDDQFCYIGLCRRHENIVVSITPDESITPEVSITPEDVVSTVGFQERLKLIEFIHTKLLELVRTFMKASHPPTPYMPCTRCSEPHIDWDDAVHTSKPLRCHDGKRIDMDYYNGLRKCQVNRFAPSTVLEQHDVAAASFIPPTSISGTTGSKGGPTQSTQDNTTSFEQVASPLTRDGRPKMWPLKKIVIPKIAADWKDVADCLDFDINTIRIIESKYTNDCVKSCEELLRDWLSTNHGKKPKTWATLLETLHEIDQLATAASDIENELQQLMKK